MNDLLESTYTHIAALRQLARDTARDDRSLVIGSVDPGTPERISAFVEQFDGYVKPAMSFGVQRAKKYPNENMARDHASRLRDGKGGKLIIRGYRDEIARALREQRAHLVWLASFDAE